MIKLENSFRYKNETILDHFSSHFVQHNFTKLEAFLFFLLLLIKMKLILIFLIILPGLLTITGATDGTWKDEQELLAAREFVRDIDYFQNLTDDELYSWWTRIRNAVTKAVKDTGKFIGKVLKHLPPIVIHFPPPRPRPETSKIMIPPKPKSFDQESQEFSS